MDNCPGVSAHLGKAMYGDWQNDENDIDVTKETIDANLLFVGKNNTETALWHFLVVGNTNAVHHFAAVPWYNNEQELVYTIFMAYEKMYKLGEYIDGSAKAMPDYKFFDFTRKSLFRALLRLLFSVDSAWSQVFCKNINDKAKTMTLWKYPVIDVQVATARVNKY